jgi:FdrA protein
LTRIGVRLSRDTYVDSVVQLAGTKAMQVQPGVDWAAAAMATAATVDTLVGEGFPASELAGADANDLVLAVRATDDEAVRAALRAGEQAMRAARPPAHVDVAPAPRTLHEALTRSPDRTVAVISVPGDYAALETHKALSAGLDVLLFSDNVDVAAEIELKDRAVAEGRLVMGPGAGTALLGGTCLGFANAVRAGRVGVVAAAGSGAQEVMSLLDRWGAGVSTVIGLGGRDLTEAVDGRMAKQAVAALRADPATEVILLVSKPPSPRVAAAVIEAASGCALVAALIGLPEGADLPRDVTVARTLEAGVLHTLDVLGLPRPDLLGDLADRVDPAMRRLGPDRRAIRGLFSGGTLCYESQVVLADVVGPVHSNAPLDPTRGLPIPRGASACLDLGEEEFTRGRPHPMIDPDSRVAQLREHGADPSVAAIVLDVILGYGCAPDPAGALAPACARIAADGGPQVIAYCLGTDLDPQGLDRQRAILRDAGCIVTETAARATLAAAALAVRDPAIIRVGVAG